MAILTVREIIDLIIMTAVVGYIFLDIFKLPREHHDPLNPPSQWNDFLFACLITAPAIIFHEMAHKFVGILFGLKAVFHAAYTWLGIGVALKLFNTGIIFFVPGYVSLTPAGSLPTAITAAAGPLLNLILFIATTLYWGERSLPIEAATIPFPKPEITPPETMINFVRMKNEISSDI